MPRKVPKTYTVLFNSEGKQDNRLVIKLDAKTIRGKLKQIENITPQNLQYFIDKEQLLPIGFQVLLTTHDPDSKETFTRANTMSPPDMAVIVDNIKRQAKEKIIDYQDDYLERLDEAGEDDLGESDWTLNPKRIEEISIRFFYSIFNKQ
jgi:hypothetical protein